MATEKVRISYEVDKKQLKASNDELAKTIKLNGLTQEEVDETNEKFDEQSKAVGTTSKAFSGLGGQLTAIGNRFTIAGKGAGDMAAGMLATTTAANTTSKAMKVLKIAIASTGIGLIVVALAALANLLTKNQKVADFFAKSMARISAVFDALSGLIGDLGPKLASLFDDPLQSLKDFGNFLLTNVINRFKGLLFLIPSLGKAVGQLFKGDFAGAAKTAGDAVALLTLGVEDFSDKTASAFQSAKNAVSSLSDEINSAIDGADKVSDLLVKMRRQEIDIVEATARRRKEIQDLLIITRDFTQSFEDQKAALAKADALELQNQSDLVAFAQTKLDIANAELATTPITLRTDEQRLAIAQAQAEVFNEQANSTAKQREILNRQNELETRRLTILNAQNAALAKQEKEKQDVLDAELDRMEELKEAEEELNIFRLEQEEMLVEAELARRAILLSNEELNAAQRVLITEQSEAKILEIKKTSEEQAVSLKKQGQDAIKGLIREGLGDTKAGAIFQIGLDTQAAAIAAFKAVVGIPVVGPALAPIAAGTAVAFGLRSARKAAGITLFEKGGRIDGNRHAQGGTLIEAERDEFMMSRKATGKYGFNFMDKINNLELDPNILSGKTGGTSVNVIDTSPIADQLKKMPQNIMNIDREGFMMHQKRGQAIISQKITRYST